MSKWEKRSLDEVCLRITDGSHNPPTATAFSEYIMLSSKNVTDDGITYNEPRYLTKQDFLIENQRTDVQPGDVLLTIVGTVGRAAVVADNIGYIALQRSVAVLKPNKNLVCSNYLKFALKSMSAELDRQANGVAQKGLYLGQVKNICVPIPPIDTQKQIADTLDKASRLIELRKTQLEKMDLLIKSKFIEMFGDPVTNPKKWKEISLGSVSEIVSGITKGRKALGKKLREVPYMRVANVKEGKIDLTEIKTIEATDIEIESYRIVDNDILMTEGGDPDKLGRGAVWNEVLKDCIHQNHIFRVRLDQNVLVPLYFAEYLKHPKAKLYFLGSSKQTTGIASINMKQLRALPVLIPHFSLQLQFSKFTEGIQKGMGLIGHNLEIMENQYKALMQEYFA